MGRGLGWLIGRRVNVTHLVDVANKPVQHAVRYVAVHDRVNLANRHSVVAVVICPYVNDLHVISITCPYEQTTAKDG